LGGRLAEAQVPVNILDHHDSVIDDQPDGDCQAAQRHQVERAAENLQEEESADHGEGKRNGGNESGAYVAQKTEENQHSEDRANQNCVTNASDGFRNKLSQRVPDGNPQCFWNRRAEVANLGLDVGRKLQNIAADLPGDIDQGGGLAVAGDQGPAVLHAVANFSHIADTDRHAVFNRHDRAADVVETGKLAGGENEILQIILRQASDGAHLVGSFELG